MGSALISAIVFIIIIIWPIMNALQNTKCTKKVQCKVPGVGHTSVDEMSFPTDAQRLCPGPDLDRVRP